MSVNSRAKGARGEREWAGVLRDAFPGRDFQRGIQTRAGGKEAADVFGLPGFHFEVKRVEALNIWAALAQAGSDADEEEIPVVAFRRNRSDWYVAVPALKFLALLPHSGDDKPLDMSRPAASEKDLKALQNGTK